MRAQPMEECARGDAHRARGGHRAERRPLTTEQRRRGPRCRSTGSRRSWAPTWARGWSGACGAPHSSAAPIRQPSPSAPIEPVPAMSSRMVHLNGWSPYFSIGHDTFLINPPGFTVVIAAVHRGFLRPTVNRGRHQGGGAAAFMLLPIAVASCARSFGADQPRLLRSPASCPSPFRCSPASASVAFQTGLYPFQVSAPLFLVALAAIVNAAREPSVRRATVAALWIASLVLVHILMATVLVYCAGCRAARHVPQP